MREGAGTLFDSGLINDGDAVVGCWLEDSRSLLMSGQGLADNDRIVWVARRGPHGPEAACLMLGRDAGRPPFDLREPAHGGCAERINVTFHHWLQIVGQVDDVLRDESSPDQRALWRRAAVVAGRTRPPQPLEDLLHRAREDLAVARQGMRPFVESLDADAVAVATGRGETRTRSWLDGTVPPLSDADYAALDRSFDPEAPLAVAWRLAPGFERLCIEVGRRSPDALRAAVREGRSGLTSLLRREVSGDGKGRHWEVATRVADHLRAVDGARASLAKHVLALKDDLAVAIARGLADLPASWTPRDARGWDDHASCHAAVRWAYAVAPTGSRADCLNVKGDWSAFASRLAAAHGLPMGRERESALARAFQDVSDVAAAYADQVLAPAIWVAAGGRQGLVPLTRPSKAGRTRLLAVASALLWSGRTACRVLEASRRWHAHQHAMLAAMPRPASSGGADWPAVLPDASYGGVDLRVLTTRASLAEEGMRGTGADGRGGLDHCVGGYAGRCLRGEGRVVSIGGPGPDGGRVRLSTAEVRLRRGKTTVVQHRGRRNQSPDGASVAALDAYLADLSAGRLVPSAPDLPLASGADPVSDAAGYDVTVPGNWEAVRDLWDAHVPRTMRGASDADLSALADLVGTKAEGVGYWRPVPRGPGDLAARARAPGPPRAVA